jgi:hypothetical protein
MSNCAGGCDPVHPTFAVVVSLIFLRISSEVFCRGRAADLGLSSLTMTSLSLLLAVVAEEAGGVGG